VEDYDFARHTKFLPLIFYHSDAIPLRLLPFQTRLTSTGIFCSPSRYTFVPLSNALLFQPLQITETEGKAADGALS